MYYDAIYKNHAKQDYTQGFIYMSVEELKIAWKSYTSNSLIKVKLKHMAAL